MALSMARHLTKSFANAYNQHQDVSSPFRRLHGQPPGDFITLDQEDWQRLLDVNLRGVAFGLRHGLPPMLERGYLCSLGLAHALLAGGGNHLRPASGVHLKE
ncbi:hypothetical protein AGR2A_pa60054 [Agrobacterium genomosp. 2 str. CFBP 5494]|uniref:Uncharacterized protein n=2 Tax=Rhizobiaceae TaxID=82115 RepID=A0A9W5F2U7_9HYPH|nr:hypothetical protein RP007_05609 [Rhizobium sp. P007]CUX02530.1 hypothetical protein AGR2A_pa60054 [Agrobacterium genomosp. 2 str. CFBP 5494]